MILYTCVVKFDAIECTQSTSKVCEVRVVYMWRQCILVCVSVCLSVFKNERIIAIVFMMSMGVYVWESASMYVFMFV